MTLDQDPGRAVPPLRARAAEQGKEDSSFGKDGGKQEFASTRQVVSLSFPPTPPSPPHPDPTFSGAPAEFSPLSQALWDSQQQLPFLDFPDPAPSAQPPYKVTVTLTSRHGTESHQTHPNAWADALATKVALEAAGVPRENGTAASCEGLLTPGQVCVCTAWHGSLPLPGGPSRSHGQMLHSWTGPWMSFSAARPYSGTC